MKQGNDWEYKGIFDFWEKDRLALGQEHLQPHPPHLQWSFLDVSNHSL